MTFFPNEFAVSYMARHRFGLILSPMAREFLRSLKFSRLRGVQKDCDGGV